MTFQRRRGLIAACVPLLVLWLAAAGHAAEPDAARPVFRRSDRRPRHDDARLESLGIHAYESKRLKLYSDLSGDAVAALPSVIDAAYEAWVTYFGPLLPDRERAEFQITGYLIGDRELFRGAGLVPAELPAFINGRHRDREFWAYDQPTDYYRRHLVIHEATHCFMSMGDFTPPPWYMEGMAELFGTHASDAAGRWIFAVMPGRPEAFDGLRRISLIRDEIRQGRSRAISGVRGLRSEDFVANTGYAWCWALCKFLDAHPRYSKAFLELGRTSSLREFDDGCRRLFEVDFPEIGVEWSLFANQLQWGHDVARAAIDFSVPPKPFSAGRQTVSIDAARGWQSAGVKLIAGQRYRISASGECVLGSEPKPWTSHPEGISIFYAEGRPIGLLLATILEDTSKSTDRGLLREISIDRNREITPKATGVLFFRINDRWGSLADNRGSYDVTIRELPPAK